MTWFWFVRATSLFKLIWLSNTCDCLNLLPVLVFCCARQLFLKKKKTKTAEEEFAIQYEQKPRTRYVVSACAAPCGKTWKHPSRLSLLWISVGSATFSQHVWWSVWFSVKTNEWNVWGPPGLLSKYILKFWKWNGWTGTSVLSVPAVAWRFCE